MYKVLTLISVVAVLSACASGSAVRTSQNTAIIQSSAAPICGGIGASQVAEKQAAIETIKAGYDSYIITSGESQNNVRVSNMGGTATTYGSVYGNTLTASTTYRPNTVVSGNHAQAYSIVMFRTGEPGSENAILARQVLGPNWAKIVSDGIQTC